MAVRGVRPVGAGLPRMVGPGYTVRYVPSREDLDAHGSGGDPINEQRQAAEEMPAGHVMVLERRRDADVAGMGATLCRRLQVRGAAGVVLDDGVRDTLQVVASALPVYGAGPAAPANDVGHHAADPQAPVSCGGVAVCLGDIVFGDAEAVVVIPAHRLDEVATEAAQMEERERFLLTEIDAGRSIAGVNPPSPHIMERCKAWRDGGLPA